MTALSANDFAAFFEAVHGHGPFPWQQRLAARVAADGTWPAVLDLPTGSGKTAAIDVAVFHLALEAEPGSGRRAPVRIAFVVDRRLVVDDACAHAQKIERALAWSLLDEMDAASERMRLQGKLPNLVEAFDRVRSAAIIAHVAGRLGTLAEEPRRPLIVRPLRGGIPREDDWARTPAQPTVLCSTVDQVGSRLLFRGYGVSDQAKPIHAGLVGADCLILLDEAHLAEPFRQTLGWVETYRGKNWRQELRASPWGVSLLTATPGETVSGTIALNADDRAHPILGARLDAEKPARLIGPAKGRAQDISSSDVDDSGAGATERENARRITALVDEAKAALATLRARGVAGPAIAVVVNRVARAREAFTRLKHALEPEAIEPILMIGPARPVDRDALVEQLAPIRTGATRSLPKPLVIVATQCIEAGVDIDLDGLVTEAAPLDALRQRFGRLNRAGRQIVPYAAVVAGKQELGAKFDDPVYERTIKPAWDYLQAIAVPPGKQGEPPSVNFGIDALRLRIEANAPAEELLYEQAVSRKPDAPVLLPAHLDLLSQTAPIPAADPEVALYLHGPQRSAASVTVVWRADLDPDMRDADSTTRRLLTLMPPRSREAIELPVWAIQNWLHGLKGAAAGRDRLADVPEIAPDEERAPRATAKRPVFRWAGDRDASEWIVPADIRPGDTIVVPAEYGGVDRYGWNPEEPGPATDVADLAADTFSGRRFVVRVAPGLLTEPIDGERREDRAQRERRTAEALIEALAAGSRRWGDLRDAARSAGLSDQLVRGLDRLDLARGGARAVQFDLDCYGEDDGRPRGVVFLAPFGLGNGQEIEDGRPGATEDDIAGSMPGYALPLDIHCGDVADKAETFARRSGLGEDRIADLKLAGALHDLGKADPRFQRLLAHDDPLGVPPEQALAKSARPAPRGFGERLGLPKNWRHEALSVRLASLHPGFAQATDKDLVLWLIGTHHGHGRPWFPHPDDILDHIDLPSTLGGWIDVPPGAGPQSLAFDWNGLDWPGLYERLKRRYGVWELAHMETILRLADHRASEEAERRVIEARTAPGREQAA